MKSSLRFFFSVSVILLVIGLICDLSWHFLSGYFLSTDASSTRQNLPYSLALADYYLTAGEIEQAITEYKSIIDIGQQPTQNLAVSRINQILSNQQHFRGRLSYMTLQLLWDVYPRLYALSGLFAVVWAGLLIFKQLNKRLSFAILPILNSTEIGGVDKLSTLTIERMHEIQWKTNNISRTLNKMISDQLELPTIGLADDGQNANIDHVLDTAWAITSGNSTISLTDFLKSLKLWINAPKYIVSGSLFEVDDSIQLRLFMHDGDNGKIVRTWHFSLPKANKSSAISILVDDIAFALFHFFNKDISTKNWRALQAATMGILCLELYFGDKNSSWLDKGENFLESALELDPDYAVARYNLGLLFMTIGQFDIARKTLKPITLP